MTRSTVLHHESATVADVRRANAYAVLEAVWREGVVTADDVITATGLSRGSVHDLCEQLMRSGWVQEVRPERPHPGAGRPARRYSFNRQAGLLVGIEAGVSRVRASVADLGGAVLGHAELATADTRAEPRSVLVRQALEGALRQAGADARDVLCLVIGVPAPVSADGRNAFHGNPFWEAMNPDLVDVLAAPGRTVLVDNVVNLVASAEAAEGQAKDVDDFIVLSIDEGFGAGVVVGGQLLRGAHGGVGELRWLDHLTGVGAPTGVATLAVQLARAAIEQHRGPSTLAGTAFDAHAVFAAAEAGDDLARGVVDEIGRRLTLIVSTLTALLDPSIVVLAGHVARSCELARRAVERGLPDHLLPPFPTVVLSTLGDDAVTTGALHRALEQVRSNALAITPPRTSTRET